MFNGNQRPGGINGTTPLLYQGSMPNMVTFSRRPTVQDGFSWPIGMWWIVPVSGTFARGEVWILASKSQGINTWKRLRSSTPTEAIVNKIYITTPGAGLYTPTTGMVQCYVECIGGGGGGGGIGTDATPLSRIYSSGGAGGGFAARMYSAAEIGASQSYSIGSGGAGGASPGSFSYRQYLTGVNGGDTTFSSGSFLITAGGGAGAGKALTSMTLGGVGSGGDVNISGQNCTTFFAVDSGAFPVAVSDTSYFYTNDPLQGAGGASGGGYGWGVPYDLNFTQYPPSGFSTQTTNGAAGGGWGGGGGGGIAINTLNAASVSGGAGADGAIVITEIIG